jgi:hypothetical protein
MEKMDHYCKNRKTVKLIESQKYFQRVWQTHYDFLWFDSPSGPRSLHF